MAHWQPTKRETKENCGKCGRTFLVALFWFYTPIENNLEHEDLKSSSVAPPRDWLIYLVLTTKF